MACIRKGVKLSRHTSFEVPRVKSRSAKYDVDEDTREEVSSRARLLMAFLSTVMEGLQDRVDEFDNFQRFGINLFLAGATEALARERDLEIEDILPTLVDCITAAGNDIAQAETFAETYENYLLVDARYSRMFDDGRSAMRAFLVRDVDARGTLERALERWAGPKPTETGEPPVTVMFTEMVEVEDEQQEAAMATNPDDGLLRDVVRAHNRVVRAALESWGGREIKFTGNGIMASFRTVSGAVGAAIAIQRTMKIHNDDNPASPIHVRIGINCGDAIAEEEDLFGTTVQVAARLCALAGAGQILCHELVRGLCIGKGLQFNNIGKHRLHGVVEPVTVFEAMWLPPIDGAMLADTSEGEAPGDGSPPERVQGEESTGTGTSGDETHDEAKVVDAEAAADDAPGGDSATTPADQSASPLEFQEIDFPKVNGEPPTDPAPAKEADADTAATDGGTAPAENVGEETAADKDTATDADKGNAEDKPDDGASHGST